MSATPKMSTQSSPLVAKVKHHTRYTNLFFSAFPIWDENKAKLVIRPIRQHSRVRCILIMQLLFILFQLCCTKMKATNYLETVEGIGITSLFVGGWLTRAEFYPDSDQIPLLNFICWLNNINLSKLELIL